MGSGVQVANFDFVSLCLSFSNGYPSAMRNGTLKQLRILTRNYLPQPPAGNNGPL
jgi:hypothetical protein